MHIVTGNKYPDNRWIIVDDNDEVIFDPRYEANRGMRLNAFAKSLHACTEYVNKPELRPELHEYYGGKEQ